MLGTLKPAKQKIFKERIFGFDIETANNNKDFVIASIVGNGYKKFFYNKEELVNEIMTNKIFKDSVIFATNLSFDFFGVFFNNPHFKLTHSGGKLICAKTHFYKGDLFIFPRSIKKGKEISEKRSDFLSNKSLKSLTFLDSLNYAQLSVKDMGNIIGIPKLKYPFTKIVDGKEIEDFRFPKDAKERVALEEYNYNDSLITYTFMKFFMETIMLFGASFKLTMASTSVSLFRNKFLKDTYIIWDTDVLDTQFLAYYGGRTEAFKRGKFPCNINKLFYYYDFNSLYPSVMYDNVFPNPNSLVLRAEPKKDLIDMYEGISEVDITCPYMKYPLLPVKRKDGRVIFPIGKLHGWYTHVELREAEKLGYVINKVYKTQYFKDTCEPFKDFIDEMYKLRNKYKKEGNKMELICKYFMNSLYGKFGEKYRDKDEWQHVDNFTFDELRELQHPDIIGNYIRIKKDREPSHSCIPIWACYVTAYGRIKLHKEIVKHGAVYVDTDSIMIDHEIPESDELGKFKKEMNIKAGYIVRPKFYALKSDKYIKGKDEFVKLKGLPVHLTMMQFYGILDKPYEMIKYDKFTTFKEAVRKSLSPNEIVKTGKLFSLEDGKRKWSEKFNMDSFQDSEPLYYDYRYDESIEEGKIQDKTEKLINYDDIINSDLFDSQSVGNDITAQDFIKNEIWFEKEGL